MSVNKTYNEELQKLEQILDEDMKVLEGSTLFDDLEGEYESLDSVLTEMKERIKELEKENEELADQVEELEAKVMEIE